MSNSFFGSSSLSLSGLTPSELNQLKNIGSTVITPANWTNLGLLNQALSTSSTPTLYGLNLGAGGLNGYAAGAQISALAYRLTPQSGGSPDQLLVESSSANNKWTRIGLYNNTAKTGLKFTIFNYENPINEVIDMLYPPSGDNKIGINQAAGTEVLEVNGNIKSSGTNIRIAKDSSSYFSLNTAAGLDNAIFGYVGTNTAYFPNSVVGDVCLKNANTGKTLRLGVDYLNSVLNIKDQKIGINKEAGTETLEFDGTMAFTSYGYTRYLLGNTGGYITTNFAKLGDTLAITFNSYVNPATNNWVVQNAGYGTTAILLQNEYVIFNTGTTNTAPETTRAVINPGGMWLPSGHRFAVGQSLGSEALEVNGNVKCTDLLASLSTNSGFTLASDNYTAFATCTLTASYVKLSSKMYAVQIFGSYSDKGSASGVAIITNFGLVPSDGVALFGSIGYAHYSMQWQASFGGRWLINDASGNVSVASLPNAATVNFNGILVLP